MGKSGLHPAHYICTVLGGILKIFLVQYLILHQKDVGSETFRALQGLDPRFPDSQTGSLLTQNLRRGFVYLNFGHWAEHRIFGEGRVTRVTQ